MAHWPLLWPAVSGRSSSGLLPCLLWLGLPRRRASGCWGGLPWLLSRPQAPERGPPWQIEGELRGATKTGRGGKQGRDWHRRQGTCRGALDGKNVCAMIGYCAIVGYCGYACCPGDAIPCDYEQVLGK